MSRLPSLPTTPGEPADADAGGADHAPADDPADADAPADAVTDVVTDAGAGTAAPDGRWVAVCRIDQLTPNRGVAALVDGRQIALFRVPAATSEGPVDADRVYAIGNLDPFSHAHVLSRGVVGDTRGVPKVASPVYKQSFDLRTGGCLDDPEVSVPTYPVRVDDDGAVHVAVPRDGAP
jgi:nitrite reductase (NADH) small subunit